MTPDTKERLLPAIEMVEAAIASAHSPETAVIDDISWSVQSGDFWAVGGLPASGKTDFLMTIAALQKPLRGNIRLFGNDIAEMNEDEIAGARRKIGLVFENGGRLFKHLTVAENIALPLRYHNDWSDGEANNSVSAILKATGLTELAHQLPMKLSVSWRQRVALARALTLKPQVLLLDKPSIEQRHRPWWKEFLTKLNQGSPICDGQPVTLIVTTEDLQPWAEQAQQFALLKNNRWQLVGARAELSQSHHAWLTDDVITD